MSVLNAAVERHRVRIQTDTKQWDVTTNEASGLTPRKCWISQNGSFAVAHRGMVGLGNWMLPAILEQPDLHLALAVAELWHDRAPLEALDRMADELLLAGWDAKAGRVRAYHMKVNHRGSDRRELGEGLHLNPAPPAGVDVKDGGEVSDERLALHARAQFLFGRKFDGQLAIGGTMIVHDVTAEGVVERELGAYPDYEELAARFGDPRRGGKPAQLEQVSAVAG